MPGNFKDLEARMEPSQIAGSDERVKLIVARMILNRKTVPDSDEQIAERLRSPE